MNLDHVQEYGGGVGYVGNSARRPGDEGLLVTFWSQMQLQEYASEQAGRPVHKSVDMITITMPGNQLTRAIREANAEDKARFPVEWAAYRNQEEGASAIIGTPLSQWVVLSADQVDALRALKYVTVEQLAAATDTQLADIGMLAGMNPHALRTKAKAYLDASASQALIMAQERQVKEMSDRVAALEQQLLLSGRPVESQRGPGRPRKVQVSVDET